MPGLILTSRLELIPATITLTQAALNGTDGLGAALDATVPTTWPPEFLDPPALRFTLDRLTQHGQSGWWLHFVVLRRGPTGRMLIGSAGFKGPPSPDGTVEVGYGIVQDHRRRGYATEVVHGLLAHAFALPEVHTAVAETLPELIGSIGVLERCGFHRVEGGSEPGVIRYALSRTEYQPGANVLSL